jgi:hypothetical protein
MRAENYQFRSRNSPTTKPARRYGQLFEHDTAGVELAGWCGRREGRGTSWAATGKESQSDVTCGGSPALRYSMAAACVDVWRPPHVSADVVDPEAAVLFV